MAFTDPSYKNQGETVTQAKLQQLADNLSYLRDNVTAFNQVNGGFERDFADTNHQTLQHMAKFLVYFEYDDNKPMLIQADTNSQLTHDLTVVGDDAEPGEVGIFDLTQIDWLQPGMVYHVTNAIYAFETNFI